MGVNFLIRNRLMFHEWNMKHIHDHMAYYAIVCDYPVLAVYGPSLTAYAGQNSDPWRPVCATETLSQRPDKFRGTGTFVIF